jgi:SAM-dependent methyltransferase
MRRLLMAHCSEAEALFGTAEHIPLGDASVDAVFAAECFHWFENERALVEIARVLRPHGSLVLMWNLPAGPTEPSLAPVEQLLDQHWPKGWHLPLDLNVPDRYASGTWQTTQSVFEELQKVRLPNPQTVDPDGLVAFFASMGWIAALPDEIRLPLFNKVRSLLTASEYAVRWETIVHWTRPVAPSGYSA